MKKVVVGISGGIDSAITAYQLKQEGFEVIGAHLKITDKQLIPQEQLDQISRAINIPIQIIEGAEAFNTIVLEAFRNDHLAARTPSPCATCNPLLKWKLLFDKAEELNADFVASGHYIQKEFNDGIWYFKKGEDELKDQSYYLWGLDQEKIKKIITPLGSVSKKEVKEFATNIGLDFLSEQKESTGLCFAQGLSYPDLLKKYIPEAANIKTGNVIDTKGVIIGKHMGYIYYTIGQKRGIEFYDEQNKNICVIAIDALKNTLTVASDETLWITTFTIDHCHFTNEERILNSSKLELKVRGIGRNPKGYAKVTKLDGFKYRIQLDEPAWAMAPGQPVVFFEGEYLLGGGLMLE